MGNEFSIQIATQTAFLASSLAAGMQAADGTYDKCLLSAVSERVGDLLARREHPDSGADERLELLAALTESARVGETAPVHHSLLLHLAAGLPKSSKIQ